MEFPGSGCVIPDVKRLAKLSLSCSIFLFVQKLKKRSVCMPFFCFYLSIVLLLVRCNSEKLPAL